MEEGAETSTLDPVPGDFIWHFHNLEDAFSVLELDISNLAYDQAVLDLALNLTTKSSTAWSMAMLLMSKSSTEKPSLRLWSCPTKNRPERAQVRSFQHPLQQTP